MTVRQFKNQYLPYLKSSPSPQLDIDVLLMNVLNFSRTELLLNRDAEISEEKCVLLEQAVLKRQKGLPIAYITGHKEFYGYDFIVSQDVLIPKPDTEILVEKAIDLISDKILRKKDEILTICDMCTGSGCIGLSVLRSLIEERAIPKEMIPAFTLADISENALEIARKNALNLIPKDFLERVRFCRTNLFEALPQSFNVILTNPPYIPHEMALSLLTDGRGEPLLALDGDVLENGDKSKTCDGLALVKRLLLQGQKHLCAGGTILMECGEYNIQQAASYAEQNGFEVIKIHPDLENQLRVLELQKKSS